MKTKIFLVLSIAIITISLLFHKNRTIIFDGDKIYSIKKYSSEDKKHAYIKFKLKNYDSIIYAKFKYPKKEIFDNPTAYKEIDILHKNNLPISNNLREYAICICLSNKKIDAEFFPINYKDGYELDFSLKNENDLYIISTPFVIGNKIEAPFVPMFLDIPQIPPIPNES